MSEDDFDAILDRYFQRKGNWTLFEAVCLLEKIDPKTRQAPIDDKLGSNGEEDDDQVTRYYKVAHRAIEMTKARQVERDDDGVELPPLIEMDVDPDAVGAARHFIEPRNFVGWVTMRWPVDSEHLAEAEARYQKKKTWAGMSVAERRETARKEFWRLIKKENLDVSAHNGKVSGWAKQLEARLTRYGDAWGYERIRKEIKDWIEEGPLESGNT